jgi:uncharacterized protein YkwD
LVGVFGNASLAPCAQRICNVENVTYEIAMKKVVFIAVALILLSSCTALNILQPGTQQNDEALAPPIVFSSASAERAVNEYRQKHGLTPVRTDPAVVLVAQEQSNAMAKQHRLEHDAAGDFGARTKIIRGAKSAAENIAYGRSDFHRTLQQWINSPGHNKNLLMRSGRRMGVGVASSSKGVPYWTFVITD